MRVPYVLKYTSTLMPKLVLFLKTEAPSASELSPMGDSSLSNSAPLYCQPMGLTLTELLVERLDRANCPIKFLCFQPIKLHSLP